MKTKIYSSAPLPFMGQKRNFLKHFKEALKHYPSDAIYVDLFGGSGLLSHTVKALYPNSKVVYNDFDNYHQRIENIAKTNVILKDLRSLLSSYSRKTLLDASGKKKVISRLSKEKGFIDYITLSSSLLFSMNYAQSLDELKKQSIYNNVKVNDYNADGYLEGLEITILDYRKLFDQYKYCENVVFLIDPPYLSTESGTYKNYWKLKDYLDVLETLKGKDYFYFTSNKSSIIELCEWIETKTPNSNPFIGSTRVEFKINSHVAKWTDIMLHKKWVTTIS